MEIITKLFDMDLSKLVPEMPAFLGLVRTLLVLAVLAGPILLTVLGALYLFKPAPEANYTYGFRTYFGMGSIEAWRFSQKIAGLIFGALGVLLLLIMFIVVLTFIKKDLFQAAHTAVICLIWQAALALVARLAIAILCSVYFDKNGGPRR
ncbi:MAG: SdpI family protein [Ruminococcaceae bacterium]|nr:SdpI family protein [Oscillospiraceae bacterium]